MGATFSRTKTWSAGDILTAADQNAEFDNILNNLTTAGMDDYSANVTEMRATTDPYPSGAESLATSLQGELTRLRYLIKQITGEAQWMIDPDTDLTTLAQMALIPGFENYRNLIVKPNATNPTYQADIDADAVLVADSTGLYKKLSSVNLTVDITVSGANGLDTGAEGSSTWYHLWIIAKSDGTTAGLLSTATTLAGLTMPTGYTFGGYVGAVRNDGSSNFIAFYQEGCRVEYNAVQTVIDGTITASTWTAQSVTAFFPPTAKTTQHVLGSGGNITFGLSPRSDGHAGEYMSTGVPTTTTMGIFPTTRVGWSSLETRYAATLYYWVSTTSGTWVAVGWEY